MLHRVTGRAFKCGPSAISAIAGVPTHEAAAVIRRLTGRSVVNGVSMAELAAALIELGWEPDNAIRRAELRGPGRERAFADVPVQICATTLGRFLDGAPPGTWAIHAGNHLVAWSRGHVADSGAWFSREPAAWSRSNPDHARVALRRVREAVRFVPVIRLSPASEES